jgi:hypothetical protein
MTRQEEVAVSFTSEEEAAAVGSKTYLTGQTVARFPTAAARAAEITAPVLNQLTILDDRPGFVQFWAGTAWVDNSGPTSAALLAYADGTSNVSIPASGDAILLTVPVTVPANRQIEVSAWATAQRTAIGGLTMMARDYPGATYTASCYGYVPLAGSYCSFSTSRVFAMNAGDYTFRQTIFGGAGNTASFHYALKIMDLGAAS